MNRSGAVSLVSLAARGSLLCLAACGSLLCLAACGSVRQSPPPVQPSSTEPATAIVRVQTGQAFKSACLIVEVGATVEWRNLSPRSGVSVVSTAAPYELSSPALAAPYNLVPPERSDECLSRVGTECIEAAPFAFWRHTFRAPGVFDYRDATSGAAVSTSYSYGLPAGPTTAPSSATGTICVRESLASTQCQRVCCLGNVEGECGPGVTCVAGRCGGVPVQ
jgi:plastocyanin